MTIERDTGLQALFDQVRDKLPGETFTRGTMSEIDKLRRRAVIGWTCIGVLLAALTWLLAAALQDAVLLLTQSLNLNLVSIDNHLIAEILLPLNSVASVVALGFLALHRVFRKIFA